MNQNFCSSHPEDNDFYYLLSLITIWHFPLQDQEWMLFSVRMRDKKRRTVKTKHVPFVNCQWVAISRLAGKVTGLPRPVACAFMENGSCTDHFLQAHSSCSFHALPILRASACLPSPAASQCSRLRSDYSSYGPFHDHCVSLCSGS